MKQVYSKEEDILNLQLLDKPYWKSVELSQGIVVDLSQDGSIIAIEILHVSKVFSQDIQKILTAASILS